ncbi:MAG: putative protein kinase UbiB [Rhodospirillaceae bacterium]|nr:MAG: putative protein kinase UbiB [Rhodospirillaceae bacterium]
MLGWITHPFAGLGLLWVMGREGATDIALRLAPARSLPARILRVLSLLKGGKARSRTSGTNLAIALKRLGPTYIKLGQILSTRADLIGEDAAADLSALQDQLEPFDDRTARRILTEALGQPVEDVFADFGPAFSAASVAQVHFATLHSGEEVAVKILRPDIERRFVRELSFLRWAAGFAQALVPDLRRARPVGIIDVLREQTAMELDLRLEAAAADQMARNFADRGTLRTPAPFWDLTSQRVLVMARVEGTSIDERDLLRAQGHDLEAVLTNAATSFFEAVFEDGFFHGDQHAGNMFIDAEGKVVFVDFGIVGRLDWKGRVFLADLMNFLLEGDYDGLARRYAEEGYLPRSASTQAFALALRSVAEPIVNQPLERVSFARLLGQLLAMGRTFDMSLQPDLFLLQKNMLMAEGIARSLSPDINIWDIARPLVRDWMIEYRNPVAQLSGHAETALAAAGRLPSMLEEAESALKDLNAEMNRRRSAGSVWLGFALAAVVGAGLMWLVLQATGG